MPYTLRTIFYIAASALFILSLGGLSNQETARRGNWFGIIGMVLALVATAFREHASGYAVLIVTCSPAAESALSWPCGSR